MNPMALFILFIFLSAISGYFFPLARLLDYPAALAGLPFMLFSGYLFMDSGSRMQRSKTTFVPAGKPSALVTGGVFRITRNPIYLSVVMFLSGEAILLGSLSPFVYPVIYALLINAYVIPNEEKNLEAAFGASYLEYKKNVRRWI